MSLLRCVFQGSRFAFGFQIHGDPAVIKESNQKGFSGGQPLEKARRGRAPASVAPNTIHQATPPPKGRLCTSSFEAPSRRDSQQPPNSQHIQQC